MLSESQCHRLRGLILKVLGITVAQWLPVRATARELGINEQTLRSRIRRAEKAGTAKIARYNGTLLVEQEWARSITED